MSYKTRFKNLPISRKQPHYRYDFFPVVTQTRFFNSDLLKTPTGKTLYVIDKIAHYSVWFSVYFKQKGRWYRRKSYKMNKDDAHDYFISNSCLIERTKLNNYIGHKSKTGRASLVTPMNLVSNSNSSRKNRVPEPVPVSIN